MFSSPRWNRLQVISCFSSRPPTHPHYLAGENRRRQCLPPGKRKCQARAFWIRGHVFQTQIPLWLKPKQSPSPCGPPAETRTSTPSRRQREGMAVLSAARRKRSSVCQHRHSNRTCSVHEDRPKPAFHPGNCAIASDIMIQQWLNVSAMYIAQNQNQGTTSTTQCHTHSCEIKLEATHTTEPHFD